MKKFIIPLMTGVMVAGIIISGCAAPAAPTTPTEPTRKPTAVPQPEQTPEPTPELEPITIGLFTPLTGMVAVVGEGIYRGAVAQAEVINDEGGVLGHRIQIEVRDTEMNPEIIVTHAQELLGKGIRHFVGCPYVGTSEAVAPLMEEYGAVALLGID